MENNILLVDEKEKENARALTQSFVKKDVKSRAYTNALGAEVYLRYLKEENIADGEVYNIHNIRKILEEFDISDIMLENIHLDVRVVYNENEIFIPKSHFEYNLVPDLYIVLKIDKDYSQVEFLGFFEPKMLNKNNTNGEYYFIEKEKLSSPIDLKNFIEKFKGSTSKKYNKKDLDNAEILFVSLVDNDVNDTDKKKLLDYLKNSAELRDRFIEFENFEMLSYRTANDTAFDAITSMADSETAEASAEEEISADDIFDNIQIEEPENKEEEKDLSIDDLSAEGDISDETTGDLGGGLIGDMLSGAAVAGAEIAGAAMASAALTGATEAAETASTIAGVAETISEVAETISEVAETVPDVAETTADNISDEEDILSQENADSQDIMGMTATLDELNGIDITEDTETSVALDGLTGGMENLLPDEEMNTNEQETTELQNTVVQEDSSSDNASLDDLFGDATEDMSFEENLSLDDIEFGGASDDNDIVFEESTSADDIVFSNNDEDDIVFENNDDYDNLSSNAVSPSSSGSALSIKQGIPAAISTPISEATDLFSLENIKLGNLPPVDIPSDLGDQMETMEMDEFHRLVDSYVPTEIKDESITVDFNNFEESVIPKKEEDFVDDEILDMSDTKPAQTSPEVKKDTLTSDDFIEDMPEEVKDLSAIKKDDLTSDDFMEDMPDAINNLSSEKESLSNDDVPAPEPLAADESQEIEEVSDAAAQAENDTEDFDDDIFGIADMATAQASVEDADDFGDITIDDLVNTDEEQLPEGVDFSSGLNIGEISKAEDEQAESDITDYDAINTSSVTEENIEITEESEVQSSDDIALLDDISALEDISEEQPLANEDDFDDEDAVPAGFVPISSDANADSSLGMLYADSDNNINSEELVEESYDFRPKRKFSIMPIFAFITVAIIAATVVGFLVKNKNSIDSETLIQSAPENGILESPENDNSNVLANQEIVPAIPAEETVQDGNSTPSGNVELTKEAKDNAIKDAKAAVKQQSPAKVVVESKKPLNANKNITLKKLSWQLPNYLSHSVNMNKYLQAAGKSIKLTLSSDLLLTNEYIYSNQVKVNLKLSNDGTVQNATVVSSSGSNQVDKIVLQTVKDTLNVVKPVRGEVPTQNFNLGLIIYL